MASSYDQAVTALYQTPHEGFVAERQRLSAELKTSGDKPGAARLAKLARPSISAWAVNQLWWHARALFDELFETAGELRKGKLAARDAHRKALEQLTARARKILSEGGHAGSEGTIRRVTMTLSGLAAAGGFEPEPAGALTKDRDPPGFEAFGIASSGGDEPDEPAPKKAAQPHAAPHAVKSKANAADEHSATEAKREAAAAAERARQAAEAERKRLAEERARRKAERHALEARVREAKSELTASEHERDRLAKELATAERGVERASAAVEAAEERLAALAED